MPTIRVKDKLNAWYITILAILIHCHIPLGELERESFTNFSLDTVMIIIP